MASVARLVGTLGILAATALGSAAAAQDAQPSSYPSKAVRILVGFSPGGGSDTTARLIADALGKRWGTFPTVENRPGAGGQIARELVKDAAPDGYTLLFDSSGFTIQPALHPDLPYDPVADFAPVSLVTSQPFVLLVHPDLPVNSVEELLAMARAEPGKLNYASAGQGSNVHLSAELFKALGDVDIVQIPYEGVEGMTDLIAGRVDLTFTGLFQSLPHIQSGKLRALAVTTKTRSALLPDVPTIAESGLPDYEMQPWYGMFAPAGTPPEILQALSTAISESLQDADLKGKIAAQGLDPQGTTPENFSEIVKSELAKWADLVKVAGIKIE
jgi:tripartite-type tricarboxylate transporter receptor subunit TctC